MDALAAAARTLTLSAPEAGALEPVRESEILMTEVEISPEEQEADAQRVKAVAMRPFEEAAAKYRAKMAARLEEALDGMQSQRRSVPLTLGELHGLDDKVATSRPKKERQKETVRKLSAEELEAAEARARAAEAELLAMLDEESTKGKKKGRK